MATIKINIASATNLSDTDGPFSGSDPYVWVTLGECDPQRTATVQGSSDPEWNEELVFEGVENADDQVLKLRIYDDDWGRDDNIGECKVELCKLIASEDPQVFEKVVDDGIFTDATLKFSITTDGSFGDPPVGTVKILVKSCSGLDDADFFGKTDPYAYVVIDGCEPQQTDKQENTCNPEWNQELVFEGVERPKTKTMKIRIYDDDTFSRDDKIGECEVDMSELRLGAEPKDYELGVDFQLFGLIKQATLSFSAQLAV